jgi:hypothetical protein
MAHRHQFVQRHAGHCGAQGFQPLDGFSLAVAAYGVFGDQPGNRPAVSGDNDAFPLSMSSRSWGRWVFASEA